MPRSAILPAVPKLRHTRLAADAVFPAGVPGHLARRLTLSTGETVRVVAGPPPAHPWPAPPAPAAVVCLHGWGCSAYVFHRLLAPIADLGVRALAPDLRGHGWSSKPLDVTAYTPAALAAWVIAVLDALALDRVVLVGHSMGGAIALHTALVAPARVAALVLAAPVGFGTVGRIRQLRRLTPAPLAPLLWLAARRALVVAGLHLAYGRIGRPTARDVDEYWAPTADPDLARAARLLVHASDWAETAPEDLARLACPTHLVLGARDHLIDSAVAAACARAIPRHTVDIVPDAGHVLPEEVPDRVVAAVRGALADAANAQPRAGSPR